MTKKKLTRIDLQQMKEKVGEVRTGVEFGCQLQSVITPAPVGVTVVYVEAFGTVTPV